MTYNRNAYDLCQPACNRPVWGPAVPFLLTNICTGYDRGHNLRRRLWATFGPETIFRNKTPKTMRTIIVPTDFSATAANAAEYAASMALAMDARIILFHVYNISIGYPEVYPIPNIVELEEGYKLQLEKEKERILAFSANKLSVSTHLCMGFFFEQLKEYCLEENPYLVIMGSQGATAAERVLFGGHTVRAIKQLHRPLIAVPPHAVYHGIKKIALACDMEKMLDTLPAEELNTLVKEFNAELHVINACNKKVSAVPETVFESAMVNEMLVKANPVYHFLDAADTDKEIIHFAQEQEIDLLVILPRHHSLLERIMYRSHTKQIVQHSTVPVMTLYVPEQAG